MCAKRALSGPRVSETWHRIAGKERVRIGRVWKNDDSPLVRCHPLHGGPWWFTTVEEFLKRFEVAR